MEHGDEEVKGSPIPSEPEEGLGTGRHGTISIASTVYQIWGLIWCEVAGEGKGKVTEEGLTQTSPRTRGQLPTEPGSVQHGAASVGSRESLPWGQGPGIGVG